MRERENTIVLFSEQLNGLLKEKYGSVPSAAELAMQFNLRAHGTKTISRESARKWLRGLALPEISKLMVLVEWLSLDINKIFKPSLDEKLYLEKVKIRIESKEIQDLQTILLNLLEEIPHESAKVLLITALEFRELHARSIYRLKNKNLNELRELENKLKKI